MPPQNEDEQLEQLEMEAEDLDASPQDQDVPTLAAPEAIAPSPSLPFGHPDESPSNVPAEDVAVVPAAVAEAAAIPDVHMQDDVALPLMNRLQLFQPKQLQLPLMNRLQLSQLQQLSELLQELWLRGRTFLLMCFHGRRLLCATLGVT